MKLKDVVPIIYDEIKLYEGESSYGFHTLYKGNHDHIPTEYLDWTVRSIGAIDFCVDIQIEEP